MNFEAISQGVKLAARAEPKLAKLKQASSQIEAIFLKDLMTEMRKGVNKVKWGKGFGDEIYQDMLDQQFADSASKSGSFGIGKVLYSQFSKEVIRQEAATINAGAKAPSIDIKG